MSQTWISPVNLSAPQFAKPTVTDTNFLELVTTSDADYLVTNDRPLSPATTLFWPHRQHHLSKVHCKIHTRINLSRMRAKSSCPAAKCLKSSSSAFPVSVIRKTLPSENRRGFFPSPTASQTIPSWNLCTALLVRIRNGFPSRTSGPFFPYCDSQHNFVHRQPRTYPFTFSNLGK
jgi:hypothetical protein